MTRDEVLEVIREHLADELELDPARIDESTHFRADLAADSLDLYTLVQELEDTYGVKMSDEEAARIHTVARGRRLRPRPTTRRGPDRCASSTTCSKRLPDDLARQAVTHSSWTERRSDSYERLAFLGDSVLGLAVTTHLYPRLEADAYGAGRLTKIRAQAVSGRSCRRGGGAARACRSGCGRRRRRSRGRAATNALARTERVLASVIEAVIGACYLEFGYEKTAEAVVEAFTPEIEHALVAPADFKSALQERLARRGAVVRYEIDRRGGAAARADLRGGGDGGGRGGRRAAPGARRRTPSRPRRPRRWRSWGPDDAPELDHPEGLQVLPRPHAAGRSRPACR